MPERLTEEELHHRSGAPAMRGGVTRVSPQRLPPSPANQPARDDAAAGAHPDGAAPSPTAAPTDAHGAQPGWHSTRLARALLPTWLAYVAYIIARKPFSVTRSVVEEDIGLTPMMGGMVDTSFLTTYSLGQIFYSMVKKHFSARSIICLGLAGAAACCLSFSVLPHPHALIFVWGMNGIFESFGWPSCIAVVTPWLGAKERGKIMGVWGSCQAVGSLLGNWLTAGLLHTHGWEGAFRGVFSAVLACSLLVRMSLIEHPNRALLVAPAQWDNGVRPADLRECETVTADGECLVPTLEERAASGGGDKPAAPAPPESLTTVQLAALPGVLGMSASYFCQKLVRYSLLFWLPYYLSKQLGYSAVLAGYVSSAFDFGGIIGSFISGVVSDAVYGGSRRVAVCTGYILFGCGSLLLFAVAGEAMKTSVLITCVASGLVGFFFFGCDTLMTGATIQDLASRLEVPQHAGSISGFVGGVGSLGAILQGAVTAYLATNYGWDSVFHFLVLLSLAAAACMIRPMQLEKSPPKSRINV